MQSWGYFHLGMEEWRPAFVKLLGALRMEEDQRASFVTHLGVTPEQFHERFVERVLGKRRRLGPHDGGRVDLEVERAEVRFDHSLDADELASQVRTAGIPSTYHHAAELLDVIGGKDSDLVRETAAMLRLENVALKTNHVLVEGELASYSIHLGSGTVHRNPGGHLCIIPVHSQHRGRIFLPFADDDPRTAKVMSKVLLLARDKEIKDPSILEQIR